MVAIVYIYIPNFQNCARCERIKTIASIWGDNMLGSLSVDIICSSKLTDFLGKLFASSEQVMSTDKYPSIFSPQMEAIVYLTLVGLSPESS